MNGDTAQEHLSVINIVTTTKESKRSGTNPNPNGGAKRMFTVSYITRAHIAAEMSCWTNVSMEKCFKLILSLYPKLLIPKIHRLFQLRMPQHYKRRRYRPGQFLQELLQYCYQQSHLTQVLQDELLLEGVLPNAHRFLAMHT